MKRKLLNKRGIPFTLKNPETQSHHAAELRNWSAPPWFRYCRSDRKTLNGFEAGQME